MAPPKISNDEIEKTRQLYEQALADGFVPLGTPTHGGKRSAVFRVAAQCGLTAATMRERLAKYGIADTARRAATLGHNAAPPMPADMPAPGFRITANNGSFNPDGSLRQQWVQSKPDVGDVFEPPAGHVIKGVSALLDPDGRKIVEWIKTQQGDGAGLVDALRETFASYKGAAPIVAPPTMSEDDTLTVYPLPDLHIGMYAWGRETGSDYDLSIAVNRAIETVGNLIAQSRPSRRAVVLGLGDYFHANDAKAATPGSGHTLDVDGRWPKVYAAGAKLATSIVDMVAQKHAHVEVVFLPGNHDPDAAASLTVALALFYANNSRIEVHQEPGIAWYRRFGKCLLGATHGHTMKPERMAMALASDCPEEWGLTEHRHIFFGHIHHETVKEVGAVRCESFSSPAARDAWNAANGYRASRAMSAITFHIDRGEIGRHRVSISNDHTRQRIRVRAQTKKGNSP